MLVSIILSHLGGSSNDCGKESFDTEQEVETIKMHVQRIMWVVDIHLDQVIENA
jgi:hypothetical protein